MQTVWIFAVAPFLVTIQIIYSFYKSYTSPTNSIPGPWISRVTRLWYLSRVHRGSFHIENIALHEKHGQIVRIAPRWYSISAPDKSVYDIGSKFRKSDWYEGWKHPSPDRWTLFPDQDIKRHAETRKRFQRLYSMTSLLSYERYVEECNDLFVSKLTDFSRSGETVDMVHWFQCYAFDVIGDITYSSRFGFLDNGEDIANIMEALDKSMVYSTLVGIYAWAHPYLYAINEKSPGSGAAGRNFLMDFVSKKIKERNDLRQQNYKGTLKQDADEEAPRDFLDKLTDANEENPDKVTPYHIFIMGLSNIVAGSDTTAISLSGILMNLIKSPITIEKLRDEIAIQPRTAGRLSFKTTTAMPYLQAVIKEGLRMHSATGLPLWRVVPEGGAIVNGQQFLAGDVVGLNSWVAHYNREIFGQDAHVFRPERWLEAYNGNPDALRRMEAYYIPFGLGSRTCLGRHISMLEMSKILPELLERFDFSLAMQEEDWKVRNYWFVKPEKLLVRVSRREAKATSA